MAKILYAEDEMKYRRLIELFLRGEGHDVMTAPNGQELLDLYSKHPDTDMIILDVMMPVLDGLETLKIIRTYSSVPILMLTALGQVQDEVTGLKIGADDYISKPFSNEKLIARVTALLRRNKIKELKRLEDGNLAFSDPNYTVTYGSLSIVLTQKEYHLFKVLVLNKNQVMERDSLLDKVWGYAYEGDPRTLDTHIKSLRNKLGKMAKQIVTVRGKGYYYRSEL
ncbi:response regulator transcription factor [Acidaminobacter sp. JC074]|uniref:response regulator transcription factor n=1 Tax=Acidaminobacter sp. JC074 TaxID=2530199 RepID=UPI001F0CEFD4|nr:response regulator transcription factor [Acidaminobacter sp. JC074]MCH4887803.1 response regulator transcription factor [Acidaminobacter sp. JC074]